MLDSRVQRFGRRILGEPEDVTAADAGEAPGAGDEEKAERAHAAQEIGVGPSPGPALGLGEGVELEVPREVVGEDAQLLPRTVGPVVVGGHDVEGEFALELGEGFLFWAPRPQTKANSAGSPKVMLVATAEYSKCPSSGVKRSSWKFLAV